jgi:hypothetical protein
MIGGRLLRTWHDLATVQEFDVPLSEATTSSLEALQAYSLGQETSREQAAVAAVVTMTMGCSPRRRCNRRAHANVPSSHLSRRLLG